MSALPFDFQDENEGLPDQLNKESKLSFLVVHCVKGELHPHLKVLVGRVYLTDVSASVHQHQMA